jgi:hypothetical protein
VYNVDSELNTERGKMNIYDMAIKKFKNFDGHDLEVWRSNSGNSKVYMKRAGDRVDVCAIVNGKPRGCWRIGSLVMNRDYALSWKLEPEYKLKQTYKRWVQQAGGKR